MSNAWWIAGGQGLTIREQKFLFTFPVVWMFAFFMAAVVSCPPPLDSELPLVFAIGIGETLVPAFALLMLARWLSRQH